MWSVIGVRLLRKIWFAVVMAVMILPLWAMSVRAADVTDVKWVTRIDAPIPFVRVVLSLSAPVDASASINKQVLQQPYN